MIISLVGLKIPKVRVFLVGADDEQCVVKQPGATTIWKPIFYLYYFNLELFTRHLFCPYDLTLCIYNYIL